MKKALVVLSVLLFTAGSAYAGMVQTLGIGAKASAQAEAVAAQADDVYAVYYNPAGITQIERPTFAAGSVFYDAQGRIENFSAPNSTVPITKSDFRSDNPIITHPTTGFAMPITDSISFGIAAYSPYGLHVQWDENPFNNPGAYYAYESHYARIVASPTVAYKLNESLSFGFGVSLGKSVSEAGRSIPMNPDDGINPPADFTPDEFTEANALTGSGLFKAGINDIRIEAEDKFNYSINFGVLYKPVDSLSLGLTFRGRTETKFEGDVITNGQNDGTVEMEYDHPESVQFGVRYYATQKLSIEFDTTWTRWSINKDQNEMLTDSAAGRLLNAKKTYTTALEGGASAPQAAAAAAAAASSPDYMIEHPRNWEDTFQYKVGIEWQAYNSLALRFGYCYDPTPATEEGWDLGWPDTDRSTFNVGFGWRINDNWTLDGVIQRIISTPTRTVDDSHALEDVYGADVSTDMQGTLWGTGFTLSYAF